MRRPFIVIFALLIILGGYVMLFGVPEVVPSIVNEFRARLKMPNHSSYSDSVSTRATERIQMMKQTTSTKPEPELTLFSPVRELLQMDDPTQEVQLLTQVVHSWLELRDVVRMRIVLFCSNETNDLLQSAFDDVKDVVVFQPYRCFASVFNYDLNTNEFVPTLDCIFEDMNKFYGEGFHLYLNSDIVIFHDFIAAFRMSVALYQTRTVIVGRRIDVDYSHGLHPDSVVVYDWASSLKDSAILNGVGHGVYGIDYFLFHHSQSPKLPPFLIGRIEWDQWLLVYFIENVNSFVIEVSSSVIVAHVNHGQPKQSHIKSGTKTNQGIAKILPHHIVDSPIHHTKSLRQIGKLTEVDAFLSPLTSSLFARRSDAFYDLSLEKPNGNVCPFCCIINNIQSFETMMFKSHVTFGDRRLLLIVSVPTGQSESAYCFACNSNVVSPNSILFITNDCFDYSYLRFRGLLVHSAKRFCFEPEQNKETKKQPKSTNTTNESVLLPKSACTAIQNELSFIDVVFHALIAMYNVVIVDLNVVILGAVEAILRSSTVCDLQWNEPATTTSTSSSTSCDPLPVVYLKTRNRIVTMWKLYEYQLQKIMKEACSDPHFALPCFSSIFAAIVKSTSSKLRIGPVPMLDCDDSDKQQQKEDEFGISCRTVKGIINMPSAEFNNKTVLKSPQCSMPTGTVTVASPCIAIVK